MNFSFLSTLFAAEPSVWRYLPTQASDSAASVDLLFDVISWLCVFFFVAIMGTMVVFMQKYRYTGPDQKTSPIHENTKLEIVWSVFPGLLLLVLFVWGFLVWSNLNIPPGNAQEIRVIGEKWKWSFNYPKAGLTRRNKLVVPVNKNIKLVMISEDVLHSFFVPAFRIKKDVLPNRYTVVWFKAIKKGTFNVACTEYCGDQHSQMITTVEVKSQAEYNAWVESEKKKTETGQTVFAQYGCGSCHSLDGSSGTGPSFLDTAKYYGKTRKVHFGRSGPLKDIKVDDAYIRNSILNPEAHIVAGFKSAYMTSFKGKIKESQIGLLIDLIKGLKDKKSSKK